VFACHSTFRKKRFAAALSRRFHRVSKALAKLVTPAADRFVRDHDPTLKQQLSDVAQTQFDPEISANHTADDDGREAVIMIKRFVLFVTSFYRRLASNLTMPSILLEDLPRTP
jgi:hypothetical protein